MGVRGAQEYMSLSNLIKKYWDDPVWSKVIAAVIISVLATIYFWVKSLITHVPFKSVIDQSLTYLQGKSEINNTIIILIVFLSSYLVYKTIFNSIKHTVSNMSPSVDSVASTQKIQSNIIAESPTLIKKELPIISTITTVFYSDRVAGAFPGVRGLEWISSPAVAVERLGILLQVPLKFKALQEDCRPRSNLVVQGRFYITNYIF